MRNTNHNALQQSILRNQRYFGLQTNRTNKTGQIKGQLTETKGKLSVQ